MAHVASKFLKVLPLIMSLLSLYAAPAAVGGPAPFLFFAERGGFQNFSSNGRDGPGLSGLARQPGRPGFVPSAPGGRSLPTTILGTVVADAVANTNSQSHYDTNDGEAEYAGPQPWSRAWLSYCATRYETFDPDSGTYPSRNGKHRSCQTN
jgi:BA14K-like protein